MVSLEVCREGALSLFLEIILDCGDKEKNISMPPIHHCSKITHWILNPLALLRATVSTASKQQLNTTMEVSSAEASSVFRQIKWMNVCWQSTTTLLSSAPTRQLQARKQEARHTRLVTLYCQSLFSRRMKDKGELGQKFMRAEQVNLLNWCRPYHKMATDLKQNLSSKD